MNLSYNSLAVLAATFALQAAPCQNYGVSMSVTSSGGEQVGYMSEQFDCTPSSLIVDVGSALWVEMYGLADSAYILFAGAPSANCYTLPWVLGGISMEPPFMILEVGLVPAAGYLSKCGMDTAATKLPIGSNAPYGAQIVLQTAAWSSNYDLPGFSRGVMLTVK